MLHGEQEHKDTTYGSLYLLSVIPQDTFYLGCFRWLVEYLPDVSNTENPPQLDTLTFLRNPIFSRVLSADHSLRTVSRML